MVSLIIPSTVCKRFTIQLLVFSLVVSVHHTFFIVSCFYINLINLVLCSAFEQILIPFVLPLLAHCYYHNLVKSHGFRSFSYAAPHLWNYLPNNIRTARTYISFRKNLKTYLLNQAFPT